MGSIDPIGGQAIIEGVFMRSRSFIGIANRLKDGRILVKRKKFRSIIDDRYFGVKLLDIPFIRGIFVLFEVMFMGTKILIYSANLQEEDEKESLSPMHILLTVIFSIVLAIIMFKFIPLLITSLIGPKNTIVFNTVDGVIRIMLFLLYLITISRMEDVKRLFQYHGAEHKTVHCYEKGKKLTINNVKPESTLHPRCGTSFILYNFILSIIIFSFVPVSVGFWRLFLYRLPLIIPIAGISYELIKYASKRDNQIIRAMVKPGLWLQKITTREPDNDQIEVAIRALEAAKP